MTWLDGSIWPIAICLIGLSYSSPVEFVSLEEVKLGMAPLAKQDCFCARKKFNAFTFGKTQTSLTGGPILKFHLLLAHKHHGSLISDVSWAWASSREFWDHHRYYRRIFSAVLNFSIPEPSSTKTWSVYLASSWTTPPWRSSPSTCPREACSSTSGPEAGNTSQKLTRSNLPSKIIFSSCHSLIQRLL